MPLAIVFALAASLGIHAAALFGPDVELFGGADEPVMLRAELQPPPPAPVKPPAEPKPAAKPRPKMAKAVPMAVPQALPEAPVVPAPPEPDAEIVEKIGSTVASEPPEPAQPLLPAKGTLRYAIYMGTRGFQIGRAEHTWEFTEDGRYRLTGMTETIGLVALFKSIRFENESSGRLVAGGLQPELYRTRKNGKDANENADFDWASPAPRTSCRSTTSSPTCRGRKPAPPSASSPARNTTATPSIRWARRISPPRPAISAPCTCGRWAATSPKSGLRSTITVCRLKFALPTRKATSTNRSSPR